MKIIDRRLLDKMPEHDRKLHEEEALKHLPDCSEKCELVDVELLMSQIPLKGRQEVPREESQKNEE